MESTLDNTFKDAKIEFEDLDGLSWPKNLTSPQVDLDSPLLEPLFGSGKPFVPTATYETGWTNVTPSPTCCQCDFDRSACQSHPRKLTRSRRTSEVNFPRVEASDPFAFVPIPPGREQEPDQRGWAQVMESIVRPPTAKQVGNQSRPFRLLELPPGDDLSAIGPPPGLPSPRPGFRPPQGVTFPTLA